MDKIKLIQNLLIITREKKNKVIVCTDRSTTSEIKTNSVVASGLMEPSSPSSLINSVKPSSTVTGFKKLMYNSVKLTQNQLTPNYNRRKYNHSHYNQIISENTRFSRITCLSKVIRENYTASAVRSNASNLDKKVFYETNNFLKDDCFSRVPRLEPGFCSNLLRPIRPIPKIVQLIESRLDIILWRSQFSSSISSARQKVRQTKGIYVNGGLQKKASFPTIPGDFFYMMS